MRIIAVLVLGLFAWSLSADAQQPTKPPQIAILSDEIRLLRRHSHPSRKDCEISATSKGKASPSSAVTPRINTRSSRASPPSWSAYSQT